MRLPMAELTTHLGGCWAAVKLPGSDEMRQGRCENHLGAFFGESPRVVFLLVFLQSHKNQMRTHPFRDMKVDDVMTPCADF